MNVRRRLAVTTVLSAGALVLAACGGGSSPHAETPRTEMSPKDALQAAVADLASTSYAVELTSPGDGSHETGTVDPRKRTGTLNASAQSNGVDTSLDAVMMSPDVWVKLDLGPDNERLGIVSKAWMKLDTAKVAHPAALPFDLTDFSDALDLGGLLAGVDAHRDGAGSFTGTIDLTRATGVSAPDPAAVAKAGDKARTVPFQAAVDQQGRLIRIKIDGASINPDLAMEISFSDYGMAAAVTRPNDNEVVPTPDAVYQLLAS
jgi:hypothetical protein